MRTRKLNTKNRDRLVSTLRQHAMRVPNDVVQFEILNFVDDCCPKTVNPHGTGYLSPAAMLRFGGKACAIGLWNTYHPRECLYSSHPHGWSRGDVDIVEWLGIPAQKMCAIFGFDYCSGDDEQDEQDAGLLLTRRLYQKPLLQITLQDVIDQLELLE